MTKLLVEKARKRYKKQVNARRREMKYEAIGVVECEQLHYALSPYPKSISKGGAPFPIVE
jgi:hypothetical protein